MPLPNFGGGVTFVLFGNNTSSYFSTKYTLKGTPCKCFEEMLPKSVN